MGETRPTTGKIFVVGGKTVSQQQFRSATRGKRVTGKASAPRVTSPVQIRKDVTISKAKESTIPSAPLRATATRQTKRTSPRFATGIASVSAVSDDSTQQVRQPTRLEEETKMSLPRGQQKIILKQRISKLQTSIARRKPLQQFGQFIKVEPEISELIRKKRELAQLKGEPVKLTPIELSAEFYIPFAQTAVVGIATRGALGGLSKSFKAGKGFVKGTKTFIKVRKEIKKREKLAKVTDVTGRGLKATGRGVRTGAIGAGLTVFAEEVFGDFSDPTTRVRGAGKLLGGGVAFSDIIGKKAIAGATKIKVDVTKPQLTTKFKDAVKQIEVPSFIKKGQEGLGKRTFKGTTEFEVLQTSKLRKALRLEPKKVGDVKVKTDTKSFKESLPEGKRVKSFTSFAGQLTEKGKKDITSFGGSLRELTTVKKGGAFRKVKGKFKRTDLATIKSIGQLDIKPTKGKIIRKIKTGTISKAKQKGKTQTIERVVDTPLGLQQFNIKESQVEFVTGSTSKLGTQFAKGVSTIRGLPQKAPIRDFIVGGVPTAPKPPQTFKFKPQPSSVAGFTKLAFPKGKAGSVSLTSSQFSRPAINVAQAVTRPSIRGSQILQSRAGTRTLGRTPSPLAIQKQASIVARKTFLPKPPLIRTEVTRIAQPRLAPTFIGLGGLSQKSRGVLRVSEKTRVTPQTKIIDKVIPDSIVTPAPPIQIPKLTPEKGIGIIGGGLIATSILFPPFRRTPTPIVGLPLGGGGISLSGKTKVKKKKPPATLPSFSALVTGARGKLPTKKTLTGLEARLIPI